MNNYCWSWLGLKILLICLINHNNGQTQKVMPLTQRFANNQNLMPGWNAGQQQQNNINTNLNYNQQRSNYREINPDISQIISNSIMNMSLNFATLFGRYSLSGAQIYSPISIATALSLLHLGSKGQTFNEINNFFGYNRNAYPTSEIHRQFAFIIRDLLSSAQNPERPDVYWKNTRTAAEMYDVGNSNNNNNNNNRNMIEQDELQKLNIANGLFAPKSFSLQKDYEDVVKSLYKSEILNLDFQNDPQGARNYINQWVNYYTNGKIPIMLGDDIRTDTNLLIANALYFKGYWRKKFQIVPMENFFYPDGHQGPSFSLQAIVDIDNYPYYEDNVDGIKIVGIPYKGSLTTMYLIQPFDSTRQKLYQFQRTQLTPEKIDYWISQMVRKNLIIAMPQMHVTNGFSLKPILSELGISRLFSPAHADFSLISGESPQRINNLNVQNNPSVQTVSNNQKPIFNRPQQYNRPIQISFPERFGGDDNDTDNMNNETIKQNVDKQHFEVNVHNLNITEKLIRINNNSSEKNADTHRSRRSVTYKVESKIRKNDEPLSFKDFVLKKRITKSNPGKKLIRNRRQIASVNSLQNLEVLRNSQSNSKPPIWVDDIVHKVDLVINNIGTEGGAATTTVYRKSGPDITIRMDKPYIILIRHDTTKIPLFYGPVYEPPLN